MKKNVIKKVVLASTLVMAGSSLIGCAKSDIENQTKVKTGTVYKHTYTNKESSYCLGAQRGSTNIVGKTGKITINSNKSAEIDNVCFYSFLYTHALGRVTDINTSNIEIQLNYNTSRSCSSQVIGPLPKKVNEIQVPIDLELSVFTKYKTK